MKLDKRHTWIRCSLISALLFSAWEARAEDMCLPLAHGVPGMYNQPPDWSPAGGTFGKQLDDPRWTGASRHELPIFGAGMTPEVAFRGLYSGTKIYWSLQARVDPDGVTVMRDSVYVGFATGSPPTRAKILKIQFTTGDAAVDLAGDVAPGSRELKTWNWDGTSWTDTGLVEAWATADANAIGLWSVHSTTPGVGTTPDLVADTWAINVTFDTAATSDLGTALGGPVTHVWYQVARYIAGFPEPQLIVRQKWPPTSDDWDETSLTNNVANWAPLHLGTTDPACPGGIDITPQAIGTAPDVAGMPGTAVSWGAGAENTFEAYPNYTGSGVAPSAGVIKASFRIADWGSTIGDSNTSWKNILPPPGTVACDATGKISWHCGGASGVACPTLTGAGALSDQCMLVELFANEPPGGGAVHFLRDSAYRNLRFVHLSRFEDKARISIEGLSPLAGTTHRDVYIYVKTHNMPATTTNKNPPPDLKTVLNPPSRPSKKGEKGTNAAGQPGAAPTPEGSFFERVSAALPTYEVHVYHTTGKEWTAGGKRVVEIEPQVPYGYVALHETTPEGWRHSIEALGGVALEEVAPNLYHVKVPNNGSILLNTKIATCERRFFGLFRCCCNLGRTPESGGEGALAVLGLGLLLVRVVRRRRRDKGATAPDRR
jgi:hypothetical protein